MITKIISGGQSGADQAGIKAARAHGIPTGGFAPREWMTEKGPAPWLADYGLAECPKPTDKTRDAVAGWIFKSICYVERTKANAQAADVTLWFEFPENKDSKGFQATFKAVPKGRMFLAVARSVQYPPSDQFAASWGPSLNGVINIAGNRESKSPGIEAWVYQYLCEVFQAMGHKRVEP